MMTRRIVLWDDDSTVLPELRHISGAEAREPAWWLDENGRDSTFCVDTTLPMAVASIPEEDTKQLRELGRRKAGEYTNNPPQK